MAEQAFAENCPKCGSKNWIVEAVKEYAPDPEACRCWKCKHVFWLPGAIDVKETLGEPLDLESAFVEDGERTLR